MLLLLKDVADEGYRHKAEFDASDKTAANKRFDKEAHFPEVKSPLKAGKMKLPKKSGERAEAEEQQDWPEREFNLGKGEKLPKGALGLN